MTNNLTDHNNIVSFEEKRAALLARKHNYTTAPSRPLHDMEINAIDTLVIYMAHTLKIPHEFVHKSLLNKFHAQEVKEINGEDYDNAVRFLIDFTHFSCVQN